MQLAKMPLPAANHPMGRLLGYQPLKIFLDELPREGVRLQRRYRAARGPDGSSYVWIGRLRSTGSGASKRREGIDQAAFDFVSQDDPMRPGYLRLSEDIRASLFDLCDCETRRNGVTRVGQGLLTSLERKRDTEICPRTNVASLPDGSSAP
jgi:hypothetical protein